MLRSGRIEERKARRKITLAIVGSIAVLAFFALFGLKILVGFSLFIDRIRGNTPTTQSQEALILPPILDPIPSATNSSSLVVNGSGQADLTLLVYVDGEESETTTVSKNGTFTITLTDLSEGTKHISAKQRDDKGNISVLSNVLSVLIKKKGPLLELTAPEDRSTITGEDNKATISGKTEEEASVTVNGRVIVVSGDLSFTYKYPLNEGENKLTIVATDRAGNTTTIERIITYRK